MKINYNKNPLYTTVDLDENDKKILFLRLRIDDLEDRLAGVQNHLEEGEHFDLSRARKEAEYEDVSEEKTNRMFGFAIEALQGPHGGDCTCVPMSCLKCYAEEMLEINTIKGLGKHAARKVDSAFGRLNEKTIDEAIQELQDYAPVREGEWLKIPESHWIECLPRWKAEAAHAAEWLIVYRNTHCSVPVF